MDAKSVNFSRHLYLGHKRHLFCSLLSLHPRWAGVGFWMVQSASLMEVRTELCHIAKNSKGGVALFFQTQVECDKRKTSMPSKHTNFQCQQHPKCSVEEFPTRSSSSAHWVMTSPLSIRGAHCGERFPQEWGGPPVWWLLSKEEFNNHMHAFNFCGSSSRTRNVGL